MATYDYEVVGFPKTPVSGDILEVGTSRYKYSDKGTWDAHSGQNGSSLTDDQIATLEYFKYESTTDKLVASKAIETTLNSLFLGEQHKMSSGAENIFFTNKSSNINFFPMWGGVKDQSEAANQVAGEGTVAPSGRVYADYAEIEPNGSVDLSGAVLPYDSDTYFGANIAGLGIVFHIAEPITASDTFFTYKLSIGGTQVYEQTLDVTSNLAVGDAINWYFDHPVEIHAGTTIRAGVFKTDRLTGAIGDAVGVFSTADPALRYFKLRSRLFTDSDLALKTDLDSIVSGSVYKGNYDADANDPALPTGSDAQGDFYRVSVSGNGFEIGDMRVYNGTSYDHIPVQAVTQDAIEASTLKTYDIYVKSNYVGATQQGTSLHPYSSILSAISNASDGDSIFLDGTFTITTALTLPSDKSLYFYGMDTTEIKYVSFVDTNDKIFYQSSSSCTKDYHFEKIKFSNSGDYALYIRSANEVKIKDCEFTNNGWSGTGLDTILAEDGSTLGYDSDQADLQAFWAGSETSDGGAMRIRSTTEVSVVDCDVHHNLRGLRIQDCGAGGHGYITGNHCYKNIDSGIYLASGSYNASNGCENFTVYSNVTKHNANNGILVIGGINNVISLNVVEGNWNAGIMGWHVSNTRFRDMDLADNNRSQYNGIGNVGDAQASISIAGGTIHPDAAYIADVLDTQVYYSGLGSNTSRVGLKIESDVSDIDDKDVSLVNIDDVGFVGQDYALQTACDLDKVRLTVGDCRYIDTVEKNVVHAGSGNHFELPFSNHSTGVKTLNVVVDTLKMTIALHDGVGGDVINVYGVNELQSIYKGTYVDILQKGSSKIQLSDLTYPNVYVNGVVAGTTTNSMNDTLNATFEMSLVNYRAFVTSGISGGGDDREWYFIESPDGNFEYPLFKTASEANEIDTVEGGTGTSSSKTYVDDLTNTTWYYPDTNFVSNGTEAPSHGIWGGSTSIVWNEQVTDVDSNYGPTFTDIQQNVAEGSSVNIQYKPQGDTNTYNVTGVPTGYADNGFAIIGTADTITDGVDIQHVLNVTKANNYGSDTGTITIDVLNDVSNDSTDISIEGSDTPFTKAMEFDGSNDYLTAAPSNQYSQPLSLANTSGGNSGQSGYTFSGSFPWAVSVWFKCTETNTSLESPVWSKQESSSTGRILLSRKNGKLNFSFGSSYNYLVFTSTDDINTDEWYGINIQWDGGTTGTQSGSMNDYYSRFTISRVLASGNVSPIQGTWSHGNYGWSGRIRGYFRIGVDYYNSSTPKFKGQVAALTYSTLASGVPLLTDEEIAWHCNNPKKFMEDVMDVSGTPWRKAYYTSNGAYTHQHVNSHKYVNSIWMGDGVGYGGYPEAWNTLKNQAYTNTTASNMNIYAYNMTSSNMVNATPTDA